MLDEAQAVKLVETRLLPELRKEQERLNWLDKWYRWEQKDPELPRKATKELKALARLSKTPWLGLVVTTVAQAMFVDGYRSPDSQDNKPSWRTWLANSFETRQVAVHRAALAYGLAYVSVFPGLDAFGQRQAVMRGISPRRMIAVYEDPAEDDWPEYALHEKVPNKSFRLIDDQLVHLIERNSDGTLVHQGVQWHEIGFCPVVRYANELDLEGRATGEVEPFIGVASRLNKTVNDRLTTQHWNSWKVRTVAGMAEPDTEDEKTRAQLLLRQQDILIAEDPDTKFGTLDETPMDGFIAAAAADIEALAAVSQTPSHNLTGKMVNLSADALASARGPLTQKVFERQAGFGSSHGKALRLCAFVEGDMESAYDLFAHATWQDMEIRSMSQAVDALGKAAKLLGVPVQALWSKIPGVTKSDVEEWEKLVVSNDPVTAYLRDQFGPNSGGNSADSGLGF